MPFPSDIEGNERMTQRIVNITGNTVALLQRCQFFDALV
jgi:hypothetical protein